jgi:hypothetical protein
MKAGIFFTGTGPILILTTYESLNNPNLAEKLTQKGIKKYIAYEISEDLVKKRYGKHFNVIIDKKPLQEILEKDAANGLVLYRRLAKSLGNRLIQSYAIISSTFKAASSPSFGTGQVQITTATER